jgi:GH24 family phage-related lysozyme (muramidase)
MHKSVKEAFYGFTEKFEGAVPWMYLDIKGLVTVAVGNLIDPITLVRGLPFINMKTLSSATKDEIEAEWHLIKSNTQLAKKGHKAAEKLAKLRMTTQGMSNLVNSRLAQNESYLRIRFPKLDEWPADAQLALFSMAWAMGPAFKFATFEKALNAGKFDVYDASGRHLCWMNDTNNPGLRPRNIANVKLFENAAKVVKNKLDISVLHYPSLVKIDEETKAEPIADTQEPDVDAQEPVVLEPQEPSIPPTVEAPIIQVPEIKKPTIRTMNKPDKSLTFLLFMIFGSVGWLIKTIFLYFKGE